MFERYTEDARRALFFSRYEASHFGSTTIDTEHILLGLLREPKGVFGHLVARLRLDGVREEVRRRIPPREFIPTYVEIPFSQDAKNTLQATMEEAETLGHGYVGREHMLLALLRDQTTIAGSILTAHGLQIDEVREHILAFIANPNEE